MSPPRQPRKPAKGTSAELRINRGSPGLIEGPPGCPFSKMLLKSGLLLATAALSSALPHHALFARVVDSEVASSTQYDFVVAGGGTAGLTVADRLTENPNGN